MKSGMNTESSAEKKIRRKKKEILVEWLIKLDIDKYFVCHDGPPLMVQTWNIISRVLVRVAFRKHSRRNLFYTFPWSLMSDLSRFTHKCEKAYSLLVFHLDHLITSTCFINNNEFGCSQCFALAALKFWCDQFFVSLDFYFASHVWCQLLCSVCCPLCRMAPLGCN